MVNRKSNRHVSFLFEEVLELAIDYEASPHLPDDGARHSIYIAGFVSDAWFFASERMCLDCFSFCWPYFQKYVCDFVVFCFRMHLKQILF